MLDFDDYDSGRTSKEGSIVTIFGGGVTTLGDAEIFGLGGTIRDGIQLIIVI